jgi:hypothetical protein
MNENYLKPGSVQFPKISLHALFRLPDDPPDSDYFPFRFYADLLLDANNQKQMWRRISRAVGNTRLALFLFQVRDTGNMEITPELISDLRGIVSYARIRLRDGDVVKVKPTESARLRTRLDEISRRLNEAEEAYDGILGLVSNPATRLSQKKILELVLELNSAISAFKKLNSDFVSTTEDYKVQREMVIAGLRQILVFLGDGHEHPPEKINRNSVITTNELLEKAKKVEDATSTTKHIIDNCLAIIRLFVGV